MRYEFLYHGFDSDYFAYRGVSDGEDDEASIGVYRVWCVPSFVETLELLIVVF